MALHLTVLPRKFVFLGSTKIRRVYGGVEPDGCGRATRNLPLGLVTTDVSAEDVVGVPSALKYAKRRTRRPSHPFFALTRPLARLWPVSGLKPGIVIETFPPTRAFPASAEDGSMIVPTSRPASTTVAIEARGELSMAPSPRDISLPRNRPRRDRRRSPRRAGTAGVSRPARRRCRRCESP